MAYHTFEIQGKNSTKLFGQAWELKNPIGNIYFVHGYGEHSSRYHAEASRLNASGYSLYTYDQRGHGQSEGLKGYVSSFDNYISDCKTFVEQTWDDSLPGFIFGHSVGALVAVNYILDHQFQKKNFKGLITTSAAMKISRDIAPLLQKISGVVGTILPKLRTVKIDSSFISRDPEEVKKYDSDPLILRKGTHARTGAELIKAMKKMEGKFPNFTDPVLIMYGKADQLIEPGGSELFYELAASEDKELVCFEKSYHEITRDYDKDKVMNKMISWIKERT